MNPSTLVEKLIYEIITRKNGPVSEELSKLGIKYKTNYGVTVPELKSIAEPYVGNHELALELYKHEIRECKLLASMIDDPTKVTGEQIDEWAESFTNVEIVEQVCSNLLWKSDYALSRSIQWCLSNDEFLQRAGLVIAARSASNLKIKNAVFDPYLGIIENLTDNQIAKNKNSVEFALRQIAFRNEGFRRKVLEISTNMTESDSEHRAWIGSQLLFELSEEV